MLLKTFSNMTEIHLNLTIYIAQYRIIYFIWYVFMINLKNALLWIIGIEIYFRPISVRKILFLNCEQLLWLGLLSRLKSSCLVHFSSLRPLWDFYFQVKRIKRKYFTDHKEIFLSMSPTPPRTPLRRAYDFITKPRNNRVIYGEMYPERYTGIITT